MIDLEKEKELQDQIDAMRRLASYLTKKVELLEFEKSEIVMALSNIGFEPDHDEDIGRFINGNVGDFISRLSCERDDAVAVARNQDLQIEKLNGFIEGSKWGLQLRNDEVVDAVSKSFDTVVKTALRAQGG